MTERELERLIEKIGPYDHVDMQALGEDLLEQYLPNCRDPVNGLGRNLQPAVSL